MTTLRDVSERLADEHLTASELTFLSTEANLIRVLLFQPVGVIVATDTKVGVSDHALLKAQMLAFLRRARSGEVDLAACPEYSCPWEALCEAIAAGETPASGKLWAIACESIDIQMLPETLIFLRQHCRVVVDLPPAGINGNFLDCLCYLFTTTSDDGLLKPTLLIQFKTCQMGGDLYESKYLALGQTIFRFGDEGSNRLVSLICSDSLSQSFNDEIAGQLRHNTLVLHLQLNPSGEKSAFRAYREECCRENPRNTEVLCLNWAKGTKLENDSHELISEPRTILFRTAEEVETDDNQVLANHRLGCYLTYWEEYRSAAFIFSPDPQLFQFSMSKPYVVAPGPLARRAGLLMDARFEWTDGDWKSATKNANDRFEDYWFSEGPELRQYLEPVKELDVEPLIQLSTGRGLEPRLNDWKTLPSFRLETDDTARRLRLCWAKQGLGYQFRAQCFSDFRGFVGTVERKELFSARLTLFKEQPFNVSYYPAPLHKHHRNLHIEGGPSATAVFVGSTPDSLKLDRIKTSLLKRISEFDGDRELIAIWYRDQHGDLRDHMDKQVPKVSDDPGNNPVGIDNTNL